MKDKSRILTGIKNELIDLNQAVFFYINKINRFEFIFQTTSRLFILEELYAIRYLENGIILHLTTLDDDNSECSFRSLKKNINNYNFTNKKIKHLTNKLKDYRKQVNTIKIKHRNLRIAHNNTLEIYNLDEILNFDEILKPLVIICNDLGDLIYDETLLNKFNLGSHEGTVDFRKEFDKLKLNTSLIKCF
jgi:hypothetical protein